MLHYSRSEARKHLGEIINRVKFEKIIASIGRGTEGEVYVVPKPELDKELPISEINSQSGSFDFLADEPDVYSIKDLKKRYV